MGIFKIVLTVGFFFEKINVLKFDNWSILTVKSVVIFKENSENQKSSSC